MLNKFIEQIWGSKKKTTEDNYKGERIYIRVSATEKEMVEKLAEIEKRSVSNFIRHLIYVYIDNFIK